MTALSSPRSLAAALGLCLLFLGLGAPAAQAAFGITGFTGLVANPDGSSATQASAHPHSATATIEFPSVGFNDPDGQPKNTIVDLPPGFIGNPAAVPTKCTYEQLDDPAGTPVCPVSSQVGTVSLRSSGTPFVGGANVYSMVPPPGYPAMFGFRLLDAKVLLFPSVRTGGDYGVTVTGRNIQQTLAIGTVSVTFWGVPADPSHDEDRGTGAVGGVASGQQCGEWVGPGCENPAGYPPTAFLTTPADCSAGPLTTTLFADEWANPGGFLAGGRPNLSDPNWHSAGFDTDTNANPTAVSGCEQVPFDPDIVLDPTSQQADSPSGLDVHLTMPQDGLDNPDGLAQASLKRAVVTLPEGVSVNPSSANGLGACTAAQIDLNGPDPARCPDSAKIGTVSVRTPLLPDPLPGDVYLAQPFDNKFNSLLAIYIALDDPRTGIVVKLAGRVETGPNGQLKTSFDDNPQLPFSSFDLHFFGGPQAPLITPPSCGSYEIRSSFSSHAAADPDNPTAAETVTKTQSFAIASGPGGGPCPAPNQFEPGFQAGTATPLAGAYSPLIVNASRPDASQVLTGLSLDMPQGLTAKLAGVPYCSDAALAAATGQSGRSQLASSSCPAASQIGTVDVAAGAGSTPFHVEGRAFLAGPYRGAPLSVAVITPAMAGPFDLGTVLVRAGARVDPATAEIQVVSDPIPTILQGIPLKVRSISVNTDRPNFTLNPTSCDPMSLDGTLFGSSAAKALSSRFQVGACKALDFAPKLSLRLKGGTKRAQNPKLIATLKAREGEANIARAQVTLPHAAFLDQGHIRTVCTRVQWAADACPAGSVYGKVRATTPLLDHPLTGNVYLRSSSNKLPDLVADLRGPAHQPIRIELVGRTDSVHGALRNTFDLVPDAPVSTFRLELFGGKRGLVLNSRDLCAATQRATIRLDAQNGKTRDTRPAVQVDCGGKSKGAARHPRAAR